MKNMVAKQFLSTILIVFLALATMMSYTFWSFYKNSVTQIYNIGLSNLESESTLVENYLNKSTYVLWVTADTVNYMMDNGASTDDILRYLSTEARHQMEQVDENFTGIYGYIQGEYLDGIGWVPPEDYVPTERDWYTAAVEAEGKTTIVPPYLDAQTNTIMISVSQLLADGKSVVSLDIALNEVQAITKKINLDNMGYGFIMDHTGLIIAHQNEGEIGKKYPLDEEQQVIMDKSQEKENNSFEAVLNGEQCTVFSNHIMDDWYVVMVVSDQKLFHDLRKHIVLNAIVCLLVFGIILLFCTLAYHRMRKYQKRDYESRERLRNLNTNILRALAYTIDAKDRYTSGHSQRVADYSLALARRMGKSEEEQKTIYFAGLLHDVGKIRVPEEVINKPGKLTEEEFDQIKIHPISGYHILKDIYEDVRIAYGAKYHHERYDGNGYPNGLSGENIPEIARIICVADSYDAMASNRSYRNALPQEVVRREIEMGKGKQFDARIADVMLQLMAEDTEYKMCQSESVDKIILVADEDEAGIRAIQDILMEEQGYRILSAKTGDEAMRILDEELVDLVLMELFLTVSGGHPLYQKIRGAYSVPIVVMTADKSMDTISKIKEWKADDYVTKPFFPTVLKETVHAIMNSNKIK